MVPQGRAPGVGLERPNDAMLCQIDGPRGQISSLILLAGGEHILCVCDGGKTIQILSVRGTKQLLVLDVDAVVNAVASSKDGDLIVTGDVDGRVVVWETRLQKKKYEAAVQHGKIAALDVSESHIASGSNDGTVTVWEIGESFSPGRPLMDIANRARSWQAPVSSIKFSPSGRHIASAYTDWGCTVKIWRTRTRDLINSIPMPNSSPTYSLAWSSDGRRLFAGCYGGSIRCFDTVTGEPFRKVVEPRPGDDLITSLHTSTSNQFLVSFSAPAQTVDIWEIRETPACKPLYSLSQCVSASLSLDDLYLATSSGDAKISVRSLSGVVEASYFFHRLAPLMSHSEPFTYISPPAYRAWKSGELEQVELILSKEIEDERYQDFIHYSLANRALVRTRRKNFHGALGDVMEIMTNGTRIPPIAHVAKAMALPGRGKQRGAKDAFESFRGGDPKYFVECVESVILFEVEIRDQPDHEQELPTVVDHPCAWVKMCKLFLLAKYCIRRKEYSRGLQYLIDVPDFHSPDIQEAEMIQLVFGWNINDLECMVHQLRCQALFVLRHVSEAEGFLQVYKMRLDEESDARKADLGWFSERLGDEAMRRENFDDAIAWYSVSSGLYPGSRAIDFGSEFAKECLSAVEVVDQTTDGMTTDSLILTTHYEWVSVRLLVKRSKATGSKGLWESALEDASLAIEIEESCPWGYERKHAALYALARYKEAAKALSEMLTRMEMSADPRVRELGMKYVRPARTTEEIDAQIDAIRERSPFVLIHVETGKLCDAGQRKRAFKSDDTFYDLVSSTSTELDTKRIETTVAKYFRYVMFSHTWEGKEPTYEKICKESVYNGDQDRLMLKLRHFCETVRDEPEGYLWAWSDSCCIEEALRKKSIWSMYNWYRWSSLTVVLLAGDSTTLMDDLWMTRVWTLQELLAPKCIRFYHRNWELYGGESGSNHKESHRIMDELEKATKISKDTLLEFSPETYSIRARLCLASTRKATWKEDNAYGLIGIFGISTLTMEPRNPEDALGLLLQEIVHREGDLKAVLDWVGQSSPFNSCLPAQISVYANGPFTPEPITEDEMKARVEKLRTSELLRQSDLANLYQNISACSRHPTVFLYGRLSLPCITFVVSIDITGNGDIAPSSQSFVYDAQVAETFRALGKYDQTVLAYPWIRELLAQTDLPGLGDYDRALRLVASLQQEFRGLLLVKQPHEINTYKRVAADTEIRVSLPSEISSSMLRDIFVTNLEVR